MSVLILLGGVMAFSSVLFRGTGQESAPLLTVEKGPFRVSVTATGTIDPLRTVRVASECQWTVRILSLIPEGTWVRKGDIVCVLDASGIEEFLRSREVSLIKADASYQASLQQEELLKTSSERRLAEAEHQLRSAELDLQEYTQGAFPQQMQQLSEEISINGDRLSSAEDDYVFAERMWMLGFSSRPVVDAASLKLTVEAEQLRRLNAQKTLVEKFIHPRQEIQLGHRVSHSRLSLLRTELANSLAKARTHLGTLSDERRLVIYQRNVDSARRSIEACVMRAPRDGQVFYANNWSLRSRGITTIQEGKSVYFSQPVFEIPDQDHWKISLPLNETLITQVSVGMPVKVAPAGFENEEILAEITRVSPYPIARNSFAPGVKDYLLDVVLLPTEEQSRFLHARMDAEATITLFEKRDAISVPRESIIRCSGQTMVLLAQREMLLPCPVQTGEVVDGKVLIESGLQQGDQIAVAVTDEQRNGIAEKLASADSGR
jgi:HlyD family secretion protein